MKRLKLFCIGLAISLFLISCGGKDDQPENVESTEFTVTQSVSNAQIASTEKATVSLQINRTSGYKGKYFLRYSQTAGIGSLSYNAVLLKESDLYELVSDVVEISYTAATENFHQLDFTVYDNQSQQVRASVMFNEDKKGNDDSDFSAILSPAPEKIQLGESCAIRIDIKRSKIYAGSYFIKYQQASGNGLGVVSYNDAVVKPSENVALTSETIFVYYKALTANYHQIEFAISDELGHTKEFCLKFNDDKLGGDDYKFTVSASPLQRTIQENERVAISLKLAPSAIYNGKYYIKYNQIRGNGFGVVTYQGVTMTENSPILVSSNDISLSYKSTSENYHQLDFTIFDEQNRSFNLAITFNEDKKGIADQGFRITRTPLNPNIGTNSPTITYQFKKLDQDYTGKYFIQCNRVGGSGTLYLGETPVGKSLSVSNPIEVVPNSNNTINLYYWNLASSAQPFQIEVLIFDEYNFQQKDVIKFNQ